MQKTKNFLFIVFTVIVVAVSKQYEIASFKFFYFLILSETSNISGIVQKVEKSDDMSGVISYEYTVKYNVNGVSYILNERLSPDSLLNVETYSNVSVRHSINRPSFATLKNKDSIYFNFLLSIGLIVFEIFLIIKSVRIIFRNDNVSTQTE